MRRFLTWRALRYVNFPTQVLAKSCKALPIMAVNRLAGKKHSWMQYSSVSLITAGVVLFMMYREGMDHVEEQQHSLSGAVLLFFALPIRAVEYGHAVSPAYWYGVLNW